MSASVFTPVNVTSNMDETHRMMGGEVERSMPCWRRVRLEVTGCVDGVLPVSQVMFD